MTVRNGMTNLIMRWRRLVNDDDASVWSDTEAQQILDQHRLDFYQEQLTAEQIEVDGTARYYDYHVQYGNLEQQTSGTAAWRLYDSTGAEIATSTYEADYIRGRLRFDNDQAGSVRYLDGRSYDLHGAAADAWRERAADVASYYDFGADGARYSRSQWIEHCMQMAALHDQRARPVQVALIRGDLKH